MRAFDWTMAYFVPNAFYCCPSATSAGIRRQGAIRMAPGSPQLRVRGDGHGRDHHGRAPAARLNQLRAQALGGGEYLQARQGVWISWV